MKKFFIALLFYSSNCIGQIYKPILLEWKLLNNDTLHYSTKIKGVNYRTILTSKNVDVVDVLINKSSKQNFEDFENKYGDSSKAKLIGELQKIDEVLLRGSVYKKGGIHSFWLENDQKSIVALFFELPKHSVSIGDEWSISNNFIIMNRNFYSEKSNNTSKVTLSDVIIENGDSIAIIKYDISESLSGYYNMPNTYHKDGKSSETIINWHFQGIGKFLINKGRWYSYEGEFETLGLLKTKKSGKYSLVIEE